MHTEINSIYSIDNGFDYLTLDYLLNTFPYEILQIFTFSLNTCYDNNGSCIFTSNKTNTQD